jgi:hypothetical protein
MVTYNQTTTVSIPSATYTDEMFDAFEMDFAQGEQADKPMTEESRLWWFNGLPTNTDTAAIGWHIKAGVNPSLDETMQLMGVSQSLVHHRRPDKDGKIEPKPYWQLRDASLIVIAAKLQSFQEMNRNLQDRSGLAYAWQPVYDEGGQPVFNRQGKQKRQKTLKMRVFIHDLALHGYNEWFFVTLSGFTTDTMFQALTEQYRVLDTYSDYRRAQGKNDIAPFYLFSLPTTPGAMKLVGKPPDQGSIYPIMTQVPTNITKDYLKAHMTPKHLIEHIREQVLEEAIVWSIQESMRMDQGRLGQEEQRPALNGPSNEPSSVSSVQEADPLIQQPQITWIEQHYCKGDLQKVPMVCAHFGVDRPEDLRMSHFREMIGKANAALKPGEMQTLTSPSGFFSFVLRGATAALEECTIRIRIVNGSSDYCNLSYLEQGGSHCD